MRSASRNLIVAVYADEVAALCERVAALLAEHAPGEALFAWPREFVAHVAGKRELALSVTEQRSARFAEWHEAMAKAAGELLAAARKTGAVRAEVTVVDLLTLATGIAAHSAPDQHQRLLDLVRCGVGRT